LFAIFERMRDALQPTAPVTDLQSDDVHGAIRAFVSLPLLALRGDNFELFRVVMSEIMVNDELRAQYAQQVLTPTLSVAEVAFQHWVELGLIKTEQGRLIVRVLSGMVMGLMLQYIMDDDLLHAHWEALPDIVTDLIMRGIVRN
jgi:TetR/AcrR family fatty acid metabolism transcriptional regulator